MTAPLINVNAEPECLIPPRAMHVLQNPHSDARLLMNAQGIGHSIGTVDPVSTGEAVNSESAVHSAWIQRLTQLRAESTNVFDIIVDATGPCVVWRRAGPEDEAIQTPKVKDKSSDARSSDVQLTADEVGMANHMAFNALVNSSNHEFIPSSDGSSHAAGTTVAPFHATLKPQTPARAGVPVVHKEGNDKATGKISIPLQQCVSIGSTSFSDRWKAICEGYGVTAVTRTWDTQDVHPSILDHFGWEALVRSCRSWIGFIARPSVISFINTSRGTHGRSVYGRKALTPSASDEVRRGTLVWLRAFAGLRIASANCIPFLLWVDESEVSPLAFCEAGDLLEHTGIIKQEIALNDHNGRHSTITVLTHKPINPTGLSGCSEATLFNRLVQHLFPHHCSATIRSATAGTLSSPANAEHQHAREDRGRLPRVQPDRPQQTPAPHWSTSERQPRTSKRKRTADPQTIPTMVKVGKFGQSLVAKAVAHTNLSNTGVRKTTPGVVFSTHLKGTPRAVAEDTTLGGMRCSLTSMLRVPSLEEFGEQMSECLDQILDEADAARVAEGLTSYTNVLVEAVINSDETFRLDPGIVEDARTQVAAMVGCEDTAPIDQDGVSTCIRAHLLHDIAAHVGDPAAKVVHWLWDGSPAGVAQDFSEAAGLYPSSEDKIAEFHPDELKTDGIGLRNYDGVNENVDAANTLEGYHKAEYIKVTETWEECKDYLGADPVVSKLGCISRIKYGRLKHRLILDSKRSGVSRAATLPVRSVLPRLMDIIFETLESMSELMYDEDLLYFVLDFIDAFFLVPLSKKERRFFVAQFRNQFYIWLRNAQGSRGAPLVWAIFAGLFMRLAMSVVGTTGKAWRRSPYLATGHCYVDDPIFVLRGTKKQKYRSIARIIILWSVLGLPLAYKKGQCAAKVTWIGFILQKLVDRIIVTVPAEKLEEIRDLILELGKSNIVSFSDLRSLAGKLVNISTLIPILRPFLDEFWAALVGADKANDSDQVRGTAKSSSSVPPGCVWRKQIQPAMNWFYAFVTGHNGPLQRVFTLDAYLRQGDSVDIITDASPFGLGAWLRINEIPIAYFACPITDFDVSFFGFQRGDCKGQQCWEALAILVALRTWKLYWCKVRARLSNFADNVSALTALANYKARHSSMVNRVAREFALDLADAEFSPEFFVHIPGIANEVADVLSRKFDPSKTFVLPAVLNQAKEYTVEVRSVAYFRSIHTPANSGQAAAQVGGLS